MKVYWVKTLVKPRSDQSVLLSQWSNILFFENFIGLLLADYHTKNIKSFFYSDKAQEILDCFLVFTFH